MNLDGYLDDIHTQLEATAEAGGEETRELARRLAAPLDAAIRLAIQDALSAAADEITVELAPGSVELRLRGREPRFVVTPPLADEPADGASFSPLGPPPAGEDDDGAVSRINLRLPEHLKARVEQAANGEGLSVNTWLVRAAAGALEGSEGARRRERRAPHGAQRYTGWAR